MQNIHVWVGFFVHLSQSSHEIQANTNNWVKWKSCTFSHILSNQVFDEIRVALEV